MKPKFKKMRLKILLIVLLVFNIAVAQKKPFLLVGCYTSGKAEGIYVYNFNTKTGADSLLSVVKTKNPSYLAVAANNKIVYAVNETHDSINNTVGGSFSSFSFDATTGTLKLINTQLSQGTDPCYVSVTKNNKYAYVGNYSSGTLAAFSIEPNGAINSAVQVIKHEGSGPNKDRQQGPHVHSTVLSPDDNYLFASDLGIDKVTIYKINKSTGKLTPAPTPFVTTQEGSGPRHFVFAPNGKNAYLVQEMAGKVDAYHYKNGKLKKIQSASILPANFKGDIGAADIHVSKDGNFLYCSNRGSANSITIFKINKATGKIGVVGYQSTLGKTPRNFNFDPTGNFLLVANQQSDDIVIFRVNKKTGLLTDTGKKIEVPNPVCIKWIE